MTELTILIPAAGASSRMRGGDKLTEQVDGLPMLRRQAVLALAVGDAVIVTLRPTDGSRAALVADLPLTIRPVPDAAEGMAASIRAGAAGLTGAGLMVLPADMPDLTEADLQQMRQLFLQDPTRLLRATTVDGQPGHPVIFPADLFGDLGRITGDEGARAVVQRHRDKLQFCPLPQRHALTDLDTPEDWAAWRAASGRQ